MKLITYNLHKGRGRRRQSILEEAVHALQERKPDMLLCQEVFHGATDVLHQCHFITEVTGHEHVFGPNAFYDRGCHGNATFSNMPIARSDNIDISQTALERRGILRTWLDHRRGRVEALNVHFSLTAAQRWRQWAQLLQQLPNDITTPVVACGDFNDWSGALDRWASRTRILENALWSLPWSRRLSFPAVRPLIPLDRVYYRGLRLVEVEVLRGDPWQRLSDHLPIEVVFAED